MPEQKQCSRPLQDSSGLLEVSWVAQSKPWWLSECLTGRREVISPASAAWWACWGWAKEVAGGELPGRCSAEGSSSQAHTHLHPQLPHSTHTPTTFLPVKHGLASFASLQVSESLSVWACELMKISSSYWAEDQGCLPCFASADVTCMHRCAQEFSAGFRAIKDIHFYKRGRDVYSESSPGKPWWTFKQPALTKPRDQKVFCRPKNWSWCWIH